MAARPLGHRGTVTGIGSAGDRPMTAPTHTVTIREADVAQHVRGVLAAPMGPAEAARSANKHHRLTMLDQTHGS